MNKTLVFTDHPIGTNEFIIYYRYKKSRTALKHRMRTRRQRRQQMARYVAEHDKQRTHNREGSDA